MGECHWFRDLNATGSGIYMPYMTTIHEKSSTSELVAEIIKGTVHTCIFISLYTYNLYINKFIIYLFWCIKKNRIVFAD